MGFGIALVAGVLIAGRLVRPKKPSELKQMPYECGEAPQGEAWVSFNVRFYVIGLIFIIFDVESALMFPVAAAFKKLNELGLGGVVLIELLLFITVLVVGLAYCWRKSDFDWVKSFTRSNVHGNLSRYQVVNKESIKSDSKS